MTLDGKGRMTVPARHRDALTAEGDRQLTFTKSSAGCLWVFRRSGWEDFRGLLLGLPMQADGWRRLFLGSAMLEKVLLLLQRTENRLGEGERRGGSRSLDG